MGKEVSYYTFAKDDYLFLKANMEEKRIGNAMIRGKNHFLQTKRMWQYVGKQLWKRKKLLIFILIVINNKNSNEPKKQETRQLTNMLWP